MRYPFQCNWQRRWSMFKDNVNCACVHLLTQIWASGRSAIILYKEDYWRGQFYGKHWMNRSCDKNKWKSIYYLVVNKDFFVSFLRSTYHMVLLCYCCDLFLYWKLVTYGDIRKNRWMSTGTKKTLIMKIMRHCKDWAYGISVYKNCTLITSSTKCIRSYVVMWVQRGWAPAQKCTFDSERW